MEKKSVMEIVNERIYEKLEKALENGEKAMWKKSWLGGTMNHVTKHEYRGINALLLEPGEYITFKQIQALQKKNPEIKLKKGSKSEMVVFWKWYKIKEDGEDVLDGFGNPKKFAKPFYYKVFNVNDVDGIELSFNNKKNPSIDEIDKFVNNYAGKEEIVINHITGGNVASYNNIREVVTMPLIDQFESSDSYYMTLFHELTHSTGNKKRLNRDLTGKFGSAAYSEEELIAEIGANLIAGEIGVEIDIETDEDNSIEYLKGWLSVLKNDLNMISRAMQQAQKAADYFIGREFGKEEEKIEKTA